MKKTQQQKQLLIIGVIVGVVIVGVVIAVVVRQLGKGKQVEVATEETAPVKKKKVTAPLNIIGLAERPVMKLEPFAKNGKNLRITVENLPKEATEGEYEIEYTIGSATAKTATGRDTKVPENEATEGVQGFIGELEVSKLPAVTEKMLGSCSAGGACIYHAGVTEGKVTLRFAGPENYALQSWFTYFEKGKETVATVDGAFAATAKELAKASDFLIVEEMGLPTGLPGAVVEMADQGGTAGAVKARAYGVYFSAPVTVSEATVTFKDVGEATGVASWDGKTWTLLEGAKVAGGEVTVSTKGLAEIYALVK
jgi:hypothetical protein